MGLVANSEFYVPTIDISPYLKDSTSQEALTVIKEVRSACISTGFFQITGHGVTEKLRTDVFEASKRFFKLPFEEKKALDASKSIGYRGYDVLASQSYEEGVLPDLKEGFYVGTEVSKSDPLHGRFFMGPNKWPAESSLQRDKFRDPCERYYAALHSLSLKVLELVGASLLHAATDSVEIGVSSGNVRRALQVPQLFEDIGSSNPIPACPLRLLHYPSANKAADTSAKQYGASAHTDFGAITLLLQDENPGLEVLDTSTSALATSKNVWRPIDPNPEAYVVNIGDIISKVTNGLYKSSIHRVVCKRPDRERYSIVFFFDGCLDAKIRPLDGTGDGKADGKNPLTVEQHMLERLSMSYGSGKKDQRRDG